MRDDDGTLRDAELASLRLELARADELLAAALSERVRMAEWVQRFKQGAGLPLHDEAQEQAVVARFAELAAAQGVRRDAAERVAREIVAAGRLPEG